MPNMGFQVSKPDFKTAGIGYQLSTTLIESVFSPPNVALLAYLYKQYYDPSSGWWKAAGVGTLATASELYVGKMLDLPIPVLQTGVGSKKTGLEKFILKANEMDT